MALIDSSELVHEIDEAGTPMACPACKANLDGGEIPLPIRHHYSPPFHWSRAVSVSVSDGDHDHWKCPDCNWAWK